MPVAGAKPGTVIADNYRLGELIGEGAMGAVYRAVQLNLDRGVAVKLMHPQYALRADSRARFVREAQVAGSLKHPSSIQIIDFGEDQGWLYLVMELLVGAPLRAVVDADLPLLDPGRAIAIAEQVASALTAAHRIQLVHRDIKPENIFLERVPGGHDPGGADDRGDPFGERVIVVDFGLAFMADDELGTRGRLTVDGVLGGTPIYMSPEQTQGLLVGPPSDVYSLGVVLYEMLCGVPPFSGSVARVLTRHVYEAPRSPREVLADRVAAGAVTAQDAAPDGKWSAPDAGATRPLPDNPIALEQLVMRMLHKSPADRPPAEQVVRALEEIGGEIVADSGAESRIGARRGRSRGRSQVGDRSARMIRSRGKPRASARTALGDLVAEAPGGPGLPIAVVGDIDGELVLGLAANGLDATPAAGDDLSDYAAVFAPGRDEPALRELVDCGIPVVTDVEVGDIAKLARLVRAGAAEVVTRPARADDLARKLLRAIRKSRGAG